MGADEMTSKIYKKLQLLEDDLELVVRSRNTLNDEGVLIGVVLDDDVVHIEDNALLRFLVDAIDLLDGQLVLQAELNNSFITWFCNF